MPGGIKTNKFIVVVVGFGHYCTGPMMMVVAVAVAVAVRTKQCVVYRLDFVFCVCVCLLGFLQLERLPVAGAPYSFKKPTTCAVWAVFDIVFCGFVLIYVSYIKLCVFVFKLELHNRG